MIYEPRVYQEFSEKHVMDNPEAGLFLDMGLGKTVVTLTAVNRLMFDEFEVQKVLVIAPKRVADHTWTAERDEWDHLKHLRISKILGTERQRKEALKVKADIYTINRENVVWLVTYFGGAWPFDMVVIDELSSFKSAKSQRFKALRIVRPKVKRMLGLTGTPMPNGLLDLWAQMYLLDQGQRLGKHLTHYRDKYFTPGKRNGHVVYNYEGRKPDNSDLLGEGIYVKEIYEKIGDICISMKSEDWLELPKRTDLITPVHLPKPVMDQYFEFEKKMVLQFDEENKEITALNAAGLTNKLLQFANGAVYTADKKYYEVHNEKIEALGERIEAANGQPVLVFYSFQSDVERICKHLKGMKPYKLQGTGDIDDWNKGKIPFALGHAASFGHGLNMQHGGHFIEWFGTPWSLELYQQGYKRVDRSGQKFPVFNNRLAAVATMDYDVIASLDRKDGGQEALMQAIKARIRKYRN